MDASRGEVETTDNIVNKTMCPFTLLGPQEGQDNDNWLFAEVELSPALASRAKDAAQIHVRIPYIADTRMLKIRLRTGGGNGCRNTARTRATTAVVSRALRRRGRRFRPVRMAEIWRVNSAGFSIWSFRAAF